MPSPSSGWPLSGTSFGAVLFDLDSTLVESKSVVERNWLAWARAEGVEPELLRGAHGMTSAETVAALLPPERVEEAVARIDAMELADLDGVHALPGALAAVAAVSAGARWAVVTSGGRRLATVRLGAAGIEMPETFVTYDDVAEGKPSPEPYLLGARLLGLEPGDCLVVEDSVAGLVSARDAGIGGCLAVTTTHTAEELGDLADVVVETLADVRLVVDAGRVTVEPSSRMDAGGSR